MEDCFPTCIGLKGKSQENEKRIKSMKIRVYIEKLISGEYSINHLLQAVSQTVGRRFNSSPEYTTIVFTFPKLLTYNQSQIILSWVHHPTSNIIKFIL